MTMLQAIKWAGSKRAEGWLGRRSAVSDFQHMAGLCKDIAQALDTHRDVDANEMMARLQAKMDLAKRLPAFGGKATKTV